MFSHLSAGVKEVRLAVARQASAGDVAGVGYSAGKSPLTWLFFSLAWWRVSTAVLIAVMMRELATALESADAREDQEENWY